MRERERMRELLIDSSSIQISMRRSCWIFLDARNVFLLLFIGDNRCANNVLARILSRRRRTPREVPLPRYSSISLSHDSASDSACMYTSRRFVTSDREAGSPRSQARKRAACHTRDRVEVENDGDGELCSRAASTFVAQRSTLFSLHPENSTRFPRMVTHIWYLSEGIVIDISPDIRDAERPTSVGETKREVEGERTTNVAFARLPACPRLCQTRVNAKNLTPNSLRGSPIFTSINRETRRIITSRIESGSAPFPS